MASPSKHDKDETSSVGSAPRASYSFLHSNNSSSGSINLKDASDWQTNPLIILRVELQPPRRKDTEVVLSIEFDELQVLLNPFAKWAESLGTFFAWPENLRYWSEMEMSAMNQLADLKSRIDAKLDYMMNNHSNVQIEAKIKAPVILIVDEKDVFGTPNLDVLVIDLGLITFHTEKLAKATRQRNLENQSKASVSEFSDSLFTPPRNRFPTFQNTANNEFQDTESKPPRFVDNGLLSSQLLSQLSGDKMDTKDTNFETGSVQSRPKRRHTDDGEFKDDNLPPKIRIRSSDSIKSNNTYASTFNTNYDEDAPHNELFDVFQLQVSQVEIFLIKSDLLSILDRAEFDQMKAVIVDKFEIAAEIQSSVLPWDSTLPPVKLLIDIPEIHLQISESKVKRLLYFATELLGKSNELGNKLKTRQLQEIIRNRQSEEQRNKIIPSQVKKQSQNGTDIVNDNSSVATTSMLETKSQKTKRTKSFELTSQSSSYQKYNASSFNDSDMSDDDNESFFSLDDRDEDMVRKIEIDKLRLSIQQMESNRARLMSEIRVCEADLSKVPYQLKLKAELAECEIKLREASANYVDRLISSVDVNVPNWKDELVRDRREFELAGLKDIVDSFAFSSEDALKNEFEHKRDVIHASVFKTKPQPSQFGDSKKASLKSKENKELAFVRVNLSVVNVDIQCSQSLQSFALDSGKTAPSPRAQKKIRLYNRKGNDSRDDFAKALSGSLFRFKLSGINLKLRHRTLESKVYFILRELELEDLSNSMNGSLDQPRYISEDPVYLLSSELSIFETFTSLQLARKYMPNGSTDFFKAKYEINHFNIDATTNGSEQSSFSTQNIKLSVGFLGINIAPLRLLQLAAFANCLQRSSPSDATAIDCPPTNVYETKLTQNNSSLGALSLIVKVDCINICLLDPLSNPVLIANIWSQHMFFHSMSGQLGVNYRITDLHLYDVSAVQIDNEEGNSSSNLLCSPKYSIFHSQQDDAAAFLQSSFKLSVAGNEVPSIRSTVKVASIVLKLDPKGILNILKVVKDGFLLKRKDETPYISQPSEVQATATTNILDTWVMFVVDVSSGNIDMQAGAVTILLPAESSEGFKLRVHEFNTAIIWGDQSGFLGVDLSAAARGIDLSVSSHLLISPFDLFVYSVLSPSSAPDMSGSFVRPKNLSLHFATQFPPVHFPAVEKGVLQLSISLTPVKITIQEDIIIECLKWISSSSAVLTNLSFLFSADDRKISRFDEVYQFLEEDRVASDRNESISIRLKAALVIHELSVSFYRVNTDQDQNTFPQSSFAGFKRNTRLRNAGKQFADTSAFHCSKGSPAFQLVLQTLLVKLQIPGTSDESARNIEEDGCIFASLSLKTLDLECTKAGSFKRLLFSQSSILCDEDIRGANVSSETHTANVIEFAAVISKSLDLDLDLDVFRLNLAVLYPAIDSILSLSTSYFKAAVSAVNNSNVLHEGSSLNSLLVDRTKSQSEEKIPRFASQAKAYPSSVPMSLEVAEQNNTTAADIEPDVTHKVVLLSKDSFRLHDSLKSVNLTIASRSCGIWIPADPLQAQSLTLAVTADFSLNIGTNEIDSKCFERTDESNESRDFCYLKTKVELLGIGVYFASSMPKEIFLKVKSFSVLKELTHSHRYEDLDFCSVINYRENQKNIQAKETERLLVQRSIVYPFDVVLEHQMLLNISISNDSENNPIMPSGDIDWQNTGVSIASRNIVNGTISPIELQIYLDFHPLQRIFLNSMSPIAVCMNEFANKMTRIAKSSFDSLGDNQAQQTKAFHGLASRSSGNTRFSDQSSSVPQDSGARTIISSVLMIFSNCLDMSGSSATVVMETISVNIINDALSLPVPVAKLSVNGVQIQVDLPSSLQEKTRILSIFPHQQQHYQSDTSQRVDFIELPSMISAMKNTQSYRVLKLHLNAHVRLDYYNQNLIATEPFIEPFRLHLTFEQLLHSSPNSSAFILSRGITKSIYSTLEVNSTITAIVNDLLQSRSNAIMAGDKQKPVSHLHIDINKGVDINITSALVELIFSVYKSMTQFKENAIHTLRENSSEVSTILVQNESGLIVKYWTREPNNAVEVPLSSEVPIVIDYSYYSPGATERTNRFFDHQLNRSNKMINLSLHRLYGETWLPLRDVTLEGLGSKLYLLETDYSQKKTSVIDRLRNSRSPTYVVLELVSKSGIKTLKVRSMMKFFNATNMPYTIKLLASSNGSNDGRGLHTLWESIVPAHVSVPIPANLCNIPNAKFFIRPEIKYMRSIESQKKENAFLPHAEIPLPVIHGLKTDNTKKTFAYSDAAEDGRNADILDEEIAQMKSLNLLTSNEIQWRKKFLQEKGLVDKFTYHHWLNFSSPGSSSKSKETSAVFCNVNVVTKGALRDSSAAVTESAWLSTLTLEAPIKVVNLLAGNIEVTLLSVALFGDQSLKNVSQVLRLLPPTGAVTSSLLPGQSWECMHFHSTEEVVLSLKLRSDLVANTQSWSAGVIVSGSRSKSSPMTTLTLPVVFKNESHLNILVDIVDIGGTRTLSLYVPYWVVTSSFLPLQIQHCNVATSAAQSIDSSLNGVDGLASDQMFEVTKKYHENKSPINAKQTGGLNYFIILL